MSVIAGIDFNTHSVDFVLLWEEGVAGTYDRRAILGPLGDAFERTRRVRDCLPTRQWWEDEGVIAIGIEEPAGHGSGRLFRVQGAILQCLPQDVLVTPWMPSAWRKACGLAGNCPKEAVRDWIDELHGHRLGWPQDAYDAYGIAWATRSVLERQEAA